jgi:hypothetical protein
VFERRRGDLIAGVCDAAGGWDLLLVGHRIGRRRVGRVVLIENARAPSPDTADLARQIADQLGTEVVTVALNSTGPAARPSGARAEISGSEQALLGWINRIHAALVIVDLADGPLRGREQLRHLLEASRCPLLVFNASRAEPAVGYTTLIPEPPAASATDT